MNYNDKDCGAEFKPRSASIRNLKNPARQRKTRRNRLESISMFEGRKLRIIAKIILLLDLAISDSIRLIIVLLASKSSDK